MVTTPARQAHAPPQTPYAATPGSVKLPFYSPDDIDTAVEFSPPRYAFSPKPTNGKVPKAWERRPATPFRPRGNGKQKIWKRVDLDENDIDNALYLRKEKQDAASKKMVKKMKIGDHELPGVADAVGTSWDEDVEECEHKKQRDQRPRGNGVDHPDIETAAGLSKPEQPLQQRTSKQNESLRRRRPSNVSGTSENPTVSLASAPDDKLNIEEQMRSECRNAEDGYTLRIESTDDQSQTGMSESEESQGSRESAGDASGLASEATDTQTDPGDRCSKEGFEDTGSLQKPSTNIPLAEPPESTSIERCIHGHSSSPRQRSASDSSTDTDSTESAGMSPNNEIVEGSEPVDNSTMVNLPSSLTQSFIENTPDDDTEFLQGFLSRAKAKKAAKAAKSKDENTDILSLPPARNTRSRSARNVSKKEPPKPQKGLADTRFPDDIVPTEELASEQGRSSPRRSTRTRLPKPQTKSTPPVPSTIPVRRSNGTEFVFLQRDEAQKVALTTRHNTARNKGEAVHPVFRLKSLNTSKDQERLRSRSNSPRKRTRASEKQVQWDEELAKYMEEKEKEKKKNEKEAGVPRKRRRLGTPAPKRKKHTENFEQEGEQLQN
ncbi:MAG: hypothetical protein Q9227_000893 [Pyrenula ochraceoflavens]